MATLSTVPTLGITTLSDLRPEWAQSLRVNRADRTVGLYLSVLRDFDRYLADQGMPRTPEGVRREHVEAYVGSMRKRGLAPATVSLRFRALQQFWKWAVDTDEIDVSPMAKIGRPKVPENDVDVPSVDDIRRVLATCTGKTFRDRRDRAILLLLLDTGARLKELANVRLADIEHVVDPRGYDAQHFVHVTLKGGAHHRYKFGTDANAALRKYGDLRARHPQAQPGKPDADFLWIGPKGRLTDSGLYQVVRDRSREAGLAKPLHPHAFRHLAAHDFLANGGTETDLGRLMGWTKASAPRMAARYGSGLARERAEAAYERIGARSDRLLKAGNR
jgi:site-specific recombinase XerD